MVTKNIINSYGIIPYISSLTGADLSLGLERDYLGKEQPIIDEVLWREDASCPKLRTIFLDQARPIGTMLTAKGRYVSKHASKKKNSVEDFVTEFQFLKIRIDENLLGNLTPITTKVAVSYVNSNSTDYKNVVIYRRDHKRRMIPLPQNSFCRAIKTPLFKWKRTDLSEVIPLEQLVLVKNLPNGFTLRR